MSGPGSDDPFWDDPRVDTAHRGRHDMNPTDKLSVTLDAQQWEIACRLLSEAPYRLAHPLISEIQRQCLNNLAAKQPQGKSSPAHAFMVDGEGDAR
jgi:hypothetical protein